MGAEQLVAFLLILLPMLAIALALCAFGAVFDAVRGWRADNPPDDLDK